MKLNVYKIPSDTSKLEETAAELALLTEFYIRNPDVDLYKNISCLEPEGFVGENKKEAIKEIKSYSTENPETTTDDKVLDLKRDWTRLFRGVSPDYGPTPPYASMFLKESPTKVMTDMVELYIDGGYDGFQKVHDRVDYLGIAFQYLSFINLLRIHAAQEKNAQEYARLSLCFDEFFNHYVKPWVNTFCEQAEKYVRTPFYKGVLKLTKCAIA